MGKKRVLLLVHKDLVPSESTGGSVSNSVVNTTEVEVLKSLKSLKHDVQVVGVDYELSILREAIVSFKPDIVYNLLEEFQGIPLYDQNIVSYLELMKTPYTGCNPRGLMICRDKALCKKVLTYHRIPTPKFLVIPKGHKLKEKKSFPFPLIVKSLYEESSMGISQSSVVSNFLDLEKRIEFIHQSIGTDAIIEEYISGREIYVGMMGNRTLQVMPIWELDLSNLPSNSEPIATSRVKWNEEYRKKYQVKSAKAKNINADIEKKIKKLSKRVYKSLGLSGYARIDMRLSNDGQPYVIEVNPNPGVAKEEEFSLAGKALGYSYNKLQEKIIKLGLAWFKKH